MIAPSNPLISIDPILRVPGVREILAQRRDDVIAVSPIIDGAALKGPADRLLARTRSRGVSALGVADFYEGPRRHLGHRRSRRRARRRHSHARRPRRGDDHDHGRARERPPTRRGGARRERTSPRRARRRVRWCRRATTWSTLVPRGARARRRRRLRTHDLMIVTSKVVSKSEGQVVAFDGTEEHKVAIVEGESVADPSPSRAAAHHRDAPRLHQRQRRRRPLQRRRRHRRPPAQGPRPLGADESAARSLDAAASTWRSSSPTPSVACGVRASPTSRSVRPGCDPMLDLRGTHDANGRLLEATEVGDRRRDRRRGEPRAPQGRGDALRARARTRRVVLRRGLDQRATSFARRTTTCFARLHAAEAHVTGEVASRRRRALSRRRRRSARACELDPMTARVR